MAKRRPNRSSERDILSAMQFLDAIKPITLWRGLMYVEGTALAFHARGPATVKGKARRTWRVVVDGSIPGSEQWTAWLNNSGLAGVDFPTYRELLAATTEMHELDPIPRRAPAQFRMQRQPTGSYYVPELDVEITRSDWDSKTKRRWTVYDADGNQLFFSRSLRVIREQLSIWPQGA
jgi:hypothetical protein